VRTTLDIADDVLLEYKRLAAESKKPLRQIIEDALRVELARRQAVGGGSGSRQTVTFRGRGLRPGVTLDSGRDLRDLMDGQ